MVKSKRHGALPVRHPISSSTIPQSSTYPSANPSEDESDVESKIKPFPFLSLPSELRNKVYSFLFAAVPQIMDLDPSTFSLLARTRSLAIFRVSRQLYREAPHYFFSTHTFRIFPTYPGRYYKTKRPLLARLPARYRASITSLQLRVGPGWNNPPRGWVVNDALGLADCVQVRVLKVFVECDPSDAIYKGFRVSDGFYERFCAGLLDGVLRAVPSIRVVEFDAFPAVTRTGDMMSGLGKVTSMFDKVVAWGPERGWEKESDQVWLDAVLLHRDGKLCKSVAVFS